MVNLVIDNMAFIHHFLIKCNSQLDPLSWLSKYYCSLAATYFLIMLKYLIPSLMNACFSKLIIILSIRDYRVTSEMVERFPDKLSTMGGDQWLLL